MAKTYNQIKKAVLGKNYNTNNIGNSTKKRTYEEIKKDVLGGNYNDSRIKSDLETKIGFSTFSSDLSLMNDTVNNAYNSWQTQDDLVRTRNQMERMQERILAYKKYQKLFGKDNLPKLDISYHSALEGLDALSNEYAKYDNAETYNKETTRLKELGGMTSSDVKAVLDELPDLEEKAKNAKQYEQKIKDLTSNAINIRNPSAIKNLEKALNKATEERDNYLKSIGYESTEALEKALTDKRIAYTTTGGENITWDSLYKQKKQKEESDALYKEVSSMEDFGKYRDEGKNIKNPSPNEVERGISIAGWKPFGEDVGNIVEYSIDNQAGIMMSNGSATGDVVYSTMNQQERDIYNYHLGRERAGEADKGTADEYLKSIYGVLKDRWENKVLGSLTEYADEHPVLASGVSVWQNLGAGGEWLKDSANYIINGGELDDNHLAKASSAIRKTVADKVDWEIGNWDAFDFVYNTGMSMVDSAVAMTAFGVGGGAVLGLSAAAQGTNDALERGLDSKRAFWSGLSSGVFEALFESVSIGNFKSLKEVPVGFKKDIIKNIGKSMLVNASEETLTEIANIAYDLIANGDLSEAKTAIRAYISQGMSEKEAIQKVALEQGARVAEAGASGALMGLGFGGVSGVSAYKNSKSIGGTIRANDRIGEIFDIASNPEVASAYEAYTEYANKGINAENVSDAQLGKLAYSAVEEAYNIINSETATAEQKAQARKTIADLEVFAQKPPGRVSKKEAKKYDDAMVQGIIDAGLDNDTNSESYRLAMEYDAKVKSGKKLTTAEISKLVEANERAYRNEDAKAVTDRLTELGETADVPEVARIIERKMNGEAITADEYQAVKDSKYGNQVLLENTDADIVSQAEAMETDDGELFMRLYDGKTDAEAYANSFNLVAEYAKAPSIPTDYVLEHRGVLTPSQTAQIYNHFAVKASKEAKIKFDQEAQKQFTDAIAKMEENLKVSREGFVDTSVIDFTNSSAEGKVNWEDLKPRQQQAVIFVSGLFKAMGANVVFVDKTKKFNGMYHQEGDTVFVDVYAGMDIVNMMGKDSIIPTTAHELTHMMEVHSPEEFKELADMVLDYLAEVKHLTRQELIANEMARLDEKHPDDAPHSEKDAISEIVARACEDMLSASKEGRRLFESLSEEQQKSFADKVKEIFKKLTEWLDKFLNSYESTSDEAKAIRGVKSVFDEVSARWDKMLADIAVGNTADAQTEIASIGSRDLSDLSGAVGLDGKSLFQYRAFEADKDIYREMLLKHKDVIGITDLQIVELFSTIDKAVNIISNNLEALDYAWEADIDDRAFSPVKPNSDNLYKVSLDFSTLCRKRLLQQTIQATLQETLNKQLSKEEAIAIRDELMKLQEEGRKIEIACALCYVESARMKSPVQINRFLNDRESVIREFFANRDGGSIKEKIANAALKARRELAEQHPDGLIGKNDTKVDILSAPMSHMKDKYAKYIRDAKKEAKKSYELTAHERSELEAALDMSVSDFTSAEGLEWLAKNHRDIFDAYTSFVRNATHSKGIENDTWWRAGDSDAIGDNLIAQMNSENGLRSQSWSDFQVIHLLDYIAATIELSTKGAKRQSYTKVPDYVKLLGNTGDMINMSLIPTSEFSGKLAYDPVEGMAYDIAKQLRDEYHKTVGTICIGINNEQIRMLLEDATIDMVIPYHHSSMSKATRKLMHIPAWESYQDYQSEKKLSDAEAKARAKEYGVELKKDSLYQKAPKFSEWFNLEEARQIAKMENASPSDMEAYKKYGKMYGGYMAMQNAANNYLKLCAERGLAPKFSAKESDFTHDANYWKLLIDRKMVDNVTGEIIEQMPIKPIFNEQSILEILNDELARYEDVKADQEYAAQTVLRKFLSGDMKVDKSTLEALQNPVDNVTKVNILESAEGFKLSDSGRGYKSQGGYDGRRMSNRAVEAYEMGEKPMSKWTKAEILQGIEDVAYDEDISLDGLNLDKLTLAELRNNFLRNSSWHHTGAFYNATDFYEINSSAVKSITGQSINDIISARTRTRATTEERNEKRMNQEALAEAQDVYRKLAFIFDSGVTGVKRMSALINRYISGKLDIEAEYQSALDKRLKDMSATVDNWRRLPEDHWRKGDVRRFDADKIAYVEKAYTRNAVSNGDIQTIKKHILSEMTRSAEDGGVLFSDRFNTENNDIRYSRRTSNEELASMDDTALYIKNTKNANYIKMIFNGAKTEETRSRRTLDAFIGKNFYVTDGEYVYGSIVMGEPHKYTESDFHKRENQLKHRVPKGDDYDIKKGGIKWAYPIESYEKFDRPKKLSDSKEYNNSFQARQVLYSDRVEAADPVTYDDDGNVIPLSQRFNSENDDIRFSDRETSNIYDIMGERDRLYREEELLNADVAKLSEIIGTEEVENKKFLALANYLKKLSGKNVDSALLGGQLKSAYKAFQTAESLTWNDVARETYNIAESLMTRDLGVPVDYFKAVMHEIRKDKISLSEEQRAIMERKFGGYGNFHKYVFGRANITKNGIPLADAWQVWAQKYPSLFDANLSELEQIEALTELVTSLKETSTILSEYEYSEAVRHLSTEIYNKFWTIATDASVADETKTYRAEHKALMENIRKEYEKRQNDLAMHPVGETALKYESLLNKVRDTKKKEIARAKQHGRDMLDKYKDNAERKTRIQRITANALTLNKWLTKNNKDYHIHEAMKGPVIKLLNAIDFSSGRLISGGNPTQRDISLAEAFADVKTMLANATNMVTGLEELYGHDLTESIELLAEGAFALIGDNSYTINTMSNEELYHLDKLVRHIKKAVTQLNNFHVVQRSQGAWNLGEEFIEYGKKLKKLDKQHGTFGKFFVFRNRTPYYFFKELGSAGQKMFEAFQDGWDKLAFNAKKVIDFSEKTYTSKEVQKWSEEKKTFTLSQPDGSQRTIEMSIAQIMALHCVAKQDDAQYHLFGGGMTLKRIDKKGHVVTDYENISLTMSDVQMITSALNSRQIEVADKLQEFMNTVCSDWGNEISMARFGIKMFGIKDYFPIKVSSATVPTDTKKDIDNASLFRLLGMSFTKDRKHNAPQSIEIGDIFDIFAQHSADMAKYNALALPVLDFAKWYSMHGMDANGKEYGVVQTLQSVFGDEADGYLRRFVRDINGSQNVSRDVLGNKLFKNAKVASVAANLRVVLLQPTAYFKAGAVMDNKYLMKASSYVNVNPVSMIGKLKKAAEQAEKYCGIIQWKSLGYYDTDISKGLTAKIKHSDGKLDKLIEKSMKGAEIADKATFATLWIACEFEIRDTRKDLKVGSKEFYDAIGKRLRDIVYATQVVDSTMTRSDMMRSSDGRDKMLTTFGSEPILAYNMLLDLVTTYNRDKQALGKSVARKKNANKIRKVVTAYVITNAVAAIVESGFDYLRDDEDEIDVAEFMKMWLSNFVSDISIGNKLPIIKDIYSMAQGYSASRMDVQGIGYVFNAIKDVDKLLNGKGNWAKFIKDVIRAGSTLSGLPAYNIYREAMALLDKLDIVGED